MKKEIEKIYDGEVIGSDREVLSGREIDILLKGKKLGFEYHGIYWHQDDYEKSLRKRDECSKKGFELIFIWENFFLYDFDECMEFIEYKITGKNELFKTNLELETSIKDGVIFVENQTICERTKKQLEELKKDGRSIVLYHDIEYGKGDFYEDLGFKKIGEIEPKEVEWFQFSYYDLGKIIYEFKN